MPLVLLGGLVVAFLPMYYVFPDCDLGVRDVLPGAVFAAVGWALFQSLFQVYLSFSDPGASSFAGSIIVLITYLYFTALVLLVGAVVNAVVGGHSSGRPGGVGEGARPERKRREESLTRTELGAYLRSLDERLTTTYSGGRDNGEKLPPRPDGDIDLVEYSTDTEAGERWTVELSWLSESASRADQAEETVSRREAIEDRNGESPPTSSE
jgi:membrane protein